MPRPCGPRGEGPRRAETFYETAIGGVPTLLPLVKVTTDWDSLSRQFVVSPSSCGRTTPEKVVCAAYLAELGREVVRAMRSSSFSSGSSAACSVVFVIAWPGWCTIGLAVVFAPVPGPERGQDSFPCLPLPLRGPDPMPLDTRHWPVCKALFHGGLWISARSSRGRAFELITAPGRRR